MKMSLKSNFIINLAEVLHQNGTSTPELERDLISVCNSLKVKGSFLISPTSISLSIEEATDIISQNLRVFPGSLDLYKLNRLKALVNDLKTNSISIEKAIENLNQIKKDKKSYATYQVILSFSTVAACLVVFMQGKLIDIATASLTGSLVAVLSIYMKSAQLEPIKETIISFLVATMAFVIQIFIPELNVNIITISSIIILIPGLSLTISISELASKHFSSGTSRLMGAIVEFLKLGAGIIAAYHLAGYIGLKGSEQSLNEYSIFVRSIVILFSTAATSIVFNASPKDLPKILLAALSTMLFLELTNTFFSLNFSIFMTSFYAGLISNVFSLRYNKNSSTLLLPSIIFLVPGTLGIKSLQLLISQDLNLGLGEITKTVTIAILIVSGIFFADAIRPSYRISRK